MRYKDMLSYESRIKRRDYPRMVTLTDVAACADVAVSTVSKYFNGGSIRESSRKKIEEALTKLDYHPNFVARSLKTRRTNVLGVLLPNLQSSFDVNLVTAIENEISNRGYGMILTLYGNDPEKEAKMLQFLRNQQVDGIILVPSGTNHKELSDFVALGKGLVLVDRTIDGMDIDAIITDNEAISYEAISYAIAQGHRHIAIMTNPSVYTGRKRLEGYMRAIADSGIGFNNQYVKDAGWSIDCGRQMMEEILDGNPEVSLVFACSEELAIGAYQIIRERGLRIPDDISVIAFDLYGVSLITSPEISAIQQPIQDIGRSAVDTLLSENPSHGNQVFPSSLVSRNSIRKL